jgi:hypothetical protein
MERSIRGGEPTARARRFDDYLVRLALSQSNGHALGEGFRVEPPDGALLELIANRLRPRESRRGAL